MVFPLMCVPFFGGGGPLVSASVPDVISNQSTATQISASGPLVSVVGGSGSYSYLWQKLSGHADLNMVAGTEVGERPIYRTTFSAAQYGARSAVFRGRVTDNVSGLQVYTNNITVTLTRVTP